jgi:hypothetical protein
VRNLYREAMWRPIVADQTRPGLRVPSRLTFREVGSVDDVEHDDDVEVPHFGVKKDGTVVQWKILGCSDDTEGPDLLVVLRDVQPAHTDDRAARSGSGQPTHDRRLQ